MNYKVEKSNGFLLGMGLFLLFPLLFWGINYSLKDDYIILKWMLYLPTAAFMLVHIYILLGSVSMQYHINENGLLISRGIRKKQINWSDVREIIVVKGQAAIYPILGVSWPGIKHGVYVVPDIGVIKMYVTDTEKGFLCLKTTHGLFGLSPEDEALQLEISSRTGLPIKEIDVIAASYSADLSVHDDLVFNFVYYLNLFLLIFLGILLGVKYLIFGLNPMLILLLVLGIGLFFFNSSNAYRFYHYSRMGACATLVLGIIVNMLFIILSLV